MEITAVPFVYQTEVVSKKLFDNHIKLYQGYVSKINEISPKLKSASHAELAAANATYSSYRCLKRGESFSLDGVILHELYFQNLNKEPAPAGPRTRHLIDQHFGSFDAWSAAFTASANSARGWCILAFEQRTNTCRNIVLDSHDDGLVCGSYPLIILDMYEHAYMIDYGTDKGKYIQNFIANIPWGVIEKRMTAVMR